MRICDKTLLLDNEHNRGISEQIIEVLEKNNLKIYQTTNIDKAIGILKEYNINLYIINISFFFDFLKYIPANGKIIILLNLSQLGLLNRFFSTGYAVELVDYFFIPVDRHLLLHRIEFLLNQQKANVHLLEVNLEKFLWEGLLQRENHLHSLIWHDNYNHYILTKHSQYIVFFSHIFALLKDHLSQAAIKDTVQKITDLISLQMCFFNSYISFKINGEYSSQYSSDIKYFLLFLIFLSELFKIQNINTEIILHFFRDSGVYCVRMELDKNLKVFVNRYNQMYLETYHLFHYIQGYLWEHWKKNISFVENQKHILMEFYLGSVS